MGVALIAPGALDLPRLTVLDASNHQVLADGGELPGDLGDAIVAGPVFAADSSRVAVQVRERLLFWDLPNSAPLDAVVALSMGVPVARICVVRRGLDRWHRCEGRRTFRLRYRRRPLGARVLQGP